MHNRFRPYNKSLLINVFMSKEYRDIWNKYYITDYDNINIQSNNGYTALYWACFNNHTNTTKLLLNCSDIDVNIQDIFGDTALIWACFNNYTNKDIVQLLLQHSNIDINVKNLYGNTALDYAKSWGNNQEVINLLKQHNA